MRIFLTGGTGLVGTLLVKRLRERGDHVIVLSRRPEAAQQLTGDNVSVVVGDPAKSGPWMDAVADCQAVVHLAGEGLFNRRWNQAFKDLIVSSRIDSTKNIATAMARTKNAVLVSGSAIGIYGPRGDEELTEASPHGSDFLAKLCLDWENAATAAARHGVRVVLLRTGIVLDLAGGALKQMLPPFKMFVGGPIGSGKQYMSWIHNEDEVGLILFAIDQASVTGPLNATAPNPVTNKQFAQALGKVLGRPSFMPTPAFALRVMLGESAQIVTNGQRVMPAKALAAGYQFKFTEIETALRDLLAK
jgi:uncharacterized protein (TIGR01777 family)